MAEQVTKPRVFVASPDDVQAERDLLADVVGELKRGIADTKGLTLELVRWETHAWPDAGQDARDVINRFPYFIPIASDDPSPSVLASTTDRH